MKNILILGFGKSGQAVFDLLDQKKYNIYIYDQKFTCNIQNYAKKHQKNKKIIKKMIYFNNFDILKNLQIDFCIISPGISVYSKEVKFLQKNGVKIISELEVGMRLCKGKIFAITGTNGKTTTCSLLYQIFQTAGKDCYLCGNCGTPITSIAPLTRKNSLIVCEVSSFQLEHSTSIKPDFTATLNILPDHLDWHKNFTNYINAKDKINMWFGSKKIFNINDNYSKKLSEKYLNSIKLSKNCIKINKKTGKKCIFYKNQPIIDIEHINLLGEKNLENIIVAIALAKEAGISNTHIIKAIKQFDGLKHRLNIIRKNNVIFINDSKSTNVASTLFALEAVSTIKYSKLILLLGGSNKNLDFSPIFSALEKLNVIAIIYGEAKNNLVKYAHLSQVNYFVETNFYSAFQRAKHECAAGDVVLLSPACASFDEFTGYDMRGNEFLKLISKF